ncbi:MAG: response regulator [Deltaproteobacteria bacterium]|nr:response regulator [Deltaproteobacteria bacterium]
MPAKSNSSNESGELRRLAEEKVLSVFPDPAQETLSPDEVHQLLQELRVHQIELEMQNSELRRAQIELEESRARYFDLYDLAPIGYFTVSEKGLILETNLKGAALFDAAGNELLKQPLHCFILPEDQDVYYHHRRKLFETGEPQVSELRIVRRDGTQFWVRLESTLAKDAENRKTVCHIVFIDITKRKQIEEYQEMLLSSLPHVTLLIRGNDKIIVAANKIALQAGIKVGGYCWREFCKAEYLSEEHKKIIKELPEIVPPELGVKCLFCLGDECLTEAPEQNDPEVHAFGKIWDTYWIKVSDGIYLHYAIDITERNNAEEERKKLQLELVQAQKMEAIGTLAGGIAHDFNNVLGSIIGYAELALMDAPPESELKDALDQIYKGGKRAAALVKHILTFSRQAAQMRKPLRIGPILKECLKFLRASLPSTIEIVQHISTEDKTTLADPTQIHQIIMNLGTNGMHAMQDKGGCLTVKLEQVEITSKDSVANWELESGPYLRLTVSDTGKGMEPEIIERIFEPYFTTKGLGEGTGLGLSVVHGIVQSHNGAVTVSSEPGKGTEFNIYLPQTKNSIDENEHADIPLVKGTGKILLVDDEEVLVNSGKLVLERLGYEVQPFISSLAALEAFRSRPDDFDLVITDQTMPEMTGIKLAAELITIRPELPIIICTGFSANLSPEIAKLAGVKALVMKPIMHDELSKIIKNLLKGNEKTDG